MTLRSNSAAARDIAFHLHSYTNAKKNEAEGSLVLTSGKGIYVYDENGKDYIEGLAGLWCPSLGFGEERLVEAANRQMRQAALLPHLRPEGRRRDRRPGRAADRHRAGADVEGLLLQLRLRGQRHRRQDGLVLQQRARPAGEEEDHRAAMAAITASPWPRPASPGLPLNHRDFDLPIANILHTDCPHYYRFGQPGESEEQFATRMAESLEALIQREGPGDGRRLHRRAGDGRGRRHHAAGDLFREDPGGAEEARHAVHRRRGDLRLRAHRQHVRQRRPIEPPARHHDHGEGAVLGLSADLRRR